MNRFETTWLGRIHARGDAVRGSRVLVACSGGGDSVALLLFLHAVRRSLKLDLAVAHVDHGLREESAGDAAFVGELCRDLDLDLVESTLDVKHHAERTRQGIETAARELRWAWLRNEARSMGADLVATGHTLDDHTETVLMRLERGGGSGSLTPLPALSTLRWSPLIEERRDALRDYLLAKQIPWREDATNAEGFTPRNRWRALMPALRQEAPALDEHLWETHLQVAELQAFRDAQIQTWKGARFEPRPASGSIILRGSWTELELRLVLEAAFRDLGWPREARSLRDLAAWLLPLLGLRSRKTKQRGGWRLTHEGPDWRLDRNPAPDSNQGAEPPLRTDGKENP